MKAKFSTLINSAKPVLVDFYAEWCGPCHQQKPILAQLKKEIGDQARIVKIDIDKNRALANKYNIRSVPTLAIFKNGKLKWMQPGVRSATELKRLISENIG